MPMRKCHKYEIRRMYGSTKSLKPERKSTFVYIINMVRSVLLGKKEM
jgi:hypothetical protein